jgi:hypothetical protein
MNKKMAGLPKDEAGWLKAAEKEKTQRERIILGKRLKVVPTAIF